MINAIGAGMSNMMPTSSNQSLTEDQLSTIEETLSNFDADNLSQEDAMQIVEAFSDAGINPGKALGEAMAEFGFDAKTIGDMAKPEGAGQMSGQTAGNRPPPPPQQDSSEISSMVDYLTNALQEKLANSDSLELSEQDKSQIMSEFYKKFGLEEGEPIINTSA